VARQKRKGLSYIASTSKVPLCTNQVIRSAKSNRYQGFKPNNLSETRSVGSKVKPREIRAVLIMEDENDVDQSAAMGENMEISATHVPVIKAIGLNICGAPP
jgi:hypothetical protein